MPRLCIFCRFQVGPYRRSVCDVAVCVLVMSLLGCHVGQRADPGPPPGYAMYPSLEINPDLVKIFRPSNDRRWQPDQAVLAYADFDGERVTVHNIRNCTYFTADDYLVDHYDKTFDLSELESVDFIMVPFADTPLLGHTMLSFGFAGRDYLCVSVEIRKEQGESYHPLKGLFRQYEIMYVVGDERDLVGLRSNHRLDNVYVYRARTTKARVRELFLDVMRRVNQLAAEPEFYHTLTNNCSTNIRDHINRLVPERVPYDYRVLLPGYSDELAYDLALLDTDVSFAETKRRARANYQAFLYRDSPNFSVLIRQ